MGALNGEWDKIYWRFQQVGTDMRHATADALHVAACCMEGSLRHHLRMAEYCHMRAWLEAILAWDHATSEKIRAAQRALAKQQHSDNHLVERSSSADENSSNNKSSNHVNNMTFDRIAYAFWELVKENSTPSSKYNTADRCSGLPSNSSDVTQNLAAPSGSASSVQGEHSGVSGGQTGTHSKGGQLTPGRKAAIKAYQQLRTLFRAVFEALTEEPVDDQRLDVLLQTWVAAHKFRSASSVWDTPFNSPCIALDAAEAWEKAVQKQHPFLQEFLPIANYTARMVNKHVENVRVCMSELSAEFDKIVVWAPQRK